MNNKYFTIKFYENNIYLQRGFTKLFAKKFSINYRILIKLEVFDGNFDKSSLSLLSSFGTVIQLNYYTGNEFTKKTVYCTAIDVPRDRIIALLQKKKVLVLYPN